MAGGQPAAAHVGDAVGAHVGQTGRGMLAAFLLHLRAVQRIGQHEQQIAVSRHVFAGRAVAAVTLGFAAPAGE